MSVLNRTMDIRKRLIARRKAREVKPPSKTEVEAMKLLESLKAQKKELNDKQREADVVGKRRRRAIQVRAHLGEGEREAQNLRTKALQEEIAVAKKEALKDVDPFIKAKEQREAETSAKKKRDQEVALTEYLLKNPKETEQIVKEELRLAGIKDAVKRIPAQEIIDIRVAKAKYDTERKRLRDIFDADKARKVAIQNANVEDEKKRHNDVMKDIESDTTLTKQQRTAEKAAARALFQENKARIIATNANIDNEINDLALGLSVDIDEQDEKEKAEIDAIRAKAKADLEEALKVKGSGVKPKKPTKKQQEAWALATRENGQVITYK